VDLEWHQLDRRYEGLRSRHLGREKRLLASLASTGQQTPIVVVPAGERFVVVDGYKRVRALERLGQDSVRATAWQLQEAEALLLERAMRTGEADSALSQGWLLCELHERFGLSPEELARRMDKSPSWVSGRLALVRELPAQVQEHVRQGELVAHAAMKHFVPLARANREACVRLADAVAGKGLSSRDIAELYAAYRGGSETAQELVLTSPLLILRAREESRREEKEREPADKLKADLSIVAGVARRACRRLREHPLDAYAPTTRKEIDRHLRDARLDCLELFDLLEKELCDAGPEYTHGDPAAG
jgi:ParB/RepB/Spo0J family partition protein